MNMTVRNNQGRYTSRDLPCHPAFERQTNLQRSSIKPIWHHCTTHVQVIIHPETLEERDNSDYTRLLVLYTESYGRSRWDKSDVRPKEEVSCHGDGR